jgi:hypothetical protein
LLAIDDCLPDFLIPFFRLSTVAAAIGHKAFSYKGLRKRFSGANGAAQPKRRRTCLRSWQEGNTSRGLKIWPLWAGTPFTPGESMPSCLLRLALLPEPTSNRRKLPQRSQARRPRPGFACSKLLPGPQNLAQTTSRQQNTSPGQLAASVLTSQKARLTTGSSYVSNAGRLFVTVFLLKKLFRRPWGLACFRRSRCMRKQAYSEAAMQ